MTDPDLSNTLGPWFAFSDTIQIKAMSLLDQETIHLGSGGLSQPKVFAASLLSRTIMNHKAVLILLRANLISEARTLTRSCLENVLWMRRLKDEGANFVEAILDDARWADISFAKTLLPASDFMTDEEREEVRLHSVVKGPKKINPSDNTGSREAKHEYILFKALSGDSAHPSSKALSRHLPKDEQGFIADFFVEPPVNTQEVGYTIHFATTALINAMRLYAEMQPSIDDAAMLDEIGDRYNDLAEQKLLLAD